MRKSMGGLGVMMAALAAMGVSGGIGSVPRFSAYLPPLPKEKARSFTCRNCGAHFMSELSNAKFCPTEVGRRSCWLDYRTEAKGGLHESRGLQPGKEVLQGSIILRGKAGGAMQSLNDDRSRMLGVVDCMKKHGGGFVKALADCILLADRENMEKIEESWAEYIEKYSPEHWAI